MIIHKCCTIEFVSFFNTIKFVLCIGIPICILKAPMIYYERSCKKMTVIKNIVQMFFFINYELKQLFRLLSIR